MQEAAWSVLEWAADLTSQRAEKLDLDEVCGRLGVDVEALRNRRLKDSH
jgi:hypothetical protein